MLRPPVEKLPVDQTARQPKVHERLRHPLTPLVTTRQSCGDSSCKRLRRAEDEPRDDNCTADVDDVRVQKRKRLIKDMKDAPQYQSYASRRAAGLDCGDVPETPDPMAPLSKRAWEAQIYDWRVALRQGA